MPHLREVRLMPGGVRLYPAMDLIRWLDCETNGMTAELCGVAVGRVNGWKARKSRFTEAEAEEFARRLHAHPCEIWPDQWWDYEAV